jgi:carboxyl-terminal processing protease
MKRSTYSPSLLIAALIGFTLVGCHYERPISSTHKLESLLQVIGQKYVDTVNMEDLVEKTIPKILAELDPHSVYIPAQKI